MAQIVQTVKDLASSVDGFVNSIDVDDSGVPYMELALGFMALEYIFHTYLDIRQRQVRSLAIMLSVGRAGGNLPRLQCRQSLPSRSSQSLCCHGAVHACTFVVTVLHVYFLELVVSRQLQLKIHQWS